MRLALEFLAVNALMFVFFYLAVLVLILAFSFMFWEWDAVGEFMFSWAPVRFVLVFSIIINIVYWFDEGYNDYLIRQEKREQSIENK